MPWGQGPWGQGTFGSSAGYNVLDTELMSIIQLAMLEPDTQGTTWPSGMWTQAEVVGYINDRMRRFLKETGLTQNIAFNSTIANQNIFDLPQDTIDTRRVAWTSGPDTDDFIELARVDPWELDHMVDDWPTNEAPAPQSYTEALLPTLQVQVNPTPTDMGMVEVHTVALGPYADGTGLPVGVPDEYVPFICWGVKADMLNKSGEANDPARAAYAEERYQEGIELGKILISG